MRPAASKRMGVLKRWGGFVVAAGVIALASGARGADGGFIMRDPDATVQGQQQAMEAELNQGHIDEAALRVDNLFREHGTEMQQDANGVLVNVSQQWIELGQKTPALTQSYQKQFDPAARKALEKIQADPRASVADCMGVARRYPLSSVVGDCVAEAARREARLGDWSGSLDLFAAARADGWKDQGSDAKLVEELTAVQKQAGSVYNGPIPFEATWYQGAPAIPRSFPMAVGGQVVVMGLNDVFTLRSGGTVGWSAALAQPQPSDDEDDFTPYVPQPGVNRGGLRGGFGGGFGGGGGGFGGNGLGPEVSAPRVGSGRDEEGNDMSARVTAYAGALPAGATTVGGATTQPDSDAVSSGIIIVREADADQKGNGWALTALRTTDGKQLWSTRGEDEKNDAIIPPLVPDASFFRSPMVVGRYVYDMAVDIGAQMGAVSVIALDVATGKMVWRTPVGSITPESGNVGGGFGGRGGRGGRAGQVQKLAHLSYNSSIAVSGRRLVLTPDLGVAMCLDRFDGRLDWEEPTAGPQVLDADGNAMATDSLTGAPQRFDATAHVCGDVVVLAPQDSRVIRGVSGSDGHVLWQNTDMAADTLIGGDAARAIVAGKTIKALDGATGKVVWSAAEKLGDTAPAVAITGPSVVVGDQVQVPVSGDVIALSVASGESVKPDTSVPRMTPWLTNDATLQRLRDGKAAATFDKNAPPDDPPDAQPQDGQQPGGFPRLFRIVP